jgi:hypothetical protein
VRLIRVSLYEDAQKRRFVDVEGEHEPAIATLGTTGGGIAIPTTIDGRGVRFDGSTDQRPLGPAWWRTKSCDECWDKVNAVGRQARWSPDDVPHDRR